MLAMYAQLPPNQQQAHSRVRVDQHWLKGTPTDQLLKIHLLLRHGSQVPVLR
jgi:hypothetical protein